MTGENLERRLKNRMEREASSQGLAFLSYVYWPRQGVEGLWVTVGAPPREAHSRAVECLLDGASGGHAELHWLADTPAGLPGASTLLEELEGFRQADRSYRLSDRLHDTLCQSLTAAHLHLELGLLSTPETDSPFLVARELVQEATTSVRKLMSELIGGEA